MRIGALYFLRPEIAQSSQKRNRSSWRSLLCDTDVLRLGEEAQGFVAAFAADAACLHAAEGDAQVAYEPAIYPDRSGMNLFRDTMGAIQVLRPDARGQAVVGVVGIA